MKRLEEWTEADSAWLRDVWGTVTVLEMAARGFDAIDLERMAGRLGLLRVSPVDRPELRGFPMLADQCRTSTGYTHAPGGVLRMPPPIQRERAETPVIRDLTVTPKQRKRAKGRALVDA